MQVAVISGGSSSEREISLQSAQLVLDHLDPTKYEARLVLLKPHGWFDGQTGVRIQLNDFSLHLPNRSIQFEFAFLMIHGTPAEDGKLQGYFEHLSIPHSTCSTLSAALTFDKQKCKDYLKAFDVRMAKSVLVHSVAELEKLKDLSYPLFVKPNKNGSSYGVSKVIRKEELAKSIELALQYDDEVVVEEFVDGLEIGAGVVRESGVIHTLPLTDILPEGDFFDYEAKYLGASQEITPSTISSELTVQCQTIAKRLYEVLDCKGVVRFDFILKDNEFYLLEANTIPGMSPASIVPQQARAYGWSIERLLTAIVEDGLR